MESYSLAFETEELIKDINGNKNYFQSGNRKAWLNNYPLIIQEIDIQLRKYFEIPDDRKMVFSFYPLNNIKENSLKVHQEKENVINRIVISTINDEIKTNKGKNYLINSWEAYMMPSKFKFSTDIYFNKKIKLKNTKLRQRKINTNNERYILIFEYIFNRNEINKILNFDNFKQDIDVDDSVNSFLNS